MAVADGEHLQRPLAASTAVMTDTVVVPTSAVVATELLLHLFALEMRLQGCHTVWVLQLVAVAVGDGGDRHVRRAADGPQLVRLLSKLLEISMFQAIQQGLHV